MVCGQTTIQCLTLVFSNFSDCCSFESCLSGRPCFPIESCDEVSSRLCKPDCTFHSVPSASLLWGWVQHCWWTVLLGQPSYSPFCGAISRNPTTNQVSFTFGSFLFGWVMSCGVEWKGKCNGFLSQIFLTGMRFIYHLSKLPFGLPPTSLHYFSTALQKIPFQSRIPSHVINVRV